MPGCDLLRPSQRSPIPNFYLAGMLLYNSCSINNLLDLKDTVFMPCRLAEAAQSFPATFKRSAQIKGANRRIPMYAYICLMWHLMVVLHVWHMWAMLTDRDDPQLVLQATTPSKGIWLAWRAQYYLANLQRVLLLRWACI